MSTDGLAAYAILTRIILHDTPVDQAARIAFRADLLNRFEAYPRPTASAALRWLEARNELLDGSTPEELLLAGNLAAVRAALSHVPRKPPE